MENIKLENSAFLFNEIHDEMKTQGYKSISKFWKDLMVNDVLGQQNGAKVYDTGEAKYIKDEEYGLGYFPTNAFELLDLSVHLPITGFFASELVPFRTGGGAVELVSAFRSNNATVEMQQASGQGNSIPVVGGAVAKYSVPVYGWEAGIFLGALDMIKAKQGNYSILAHHEEALRESYWFRLEKSAFIGNLGVGGITTNAHADFVGGLLNQPQAKIGGILTPDKNLNDLNVADLTKFFVDIWQTVKMKVRGNLKFVPNRFALWPELYGALSQPATLDTGGTSEVPVFASKLDYLERHLTKMARTEVKFVELPYLSPNALIDGYPFRVAGQNNLGRIVIYRQDADMFTLPIPMPLTQTPLIYSPAENGYRKHALTFVGAGLLVHRPQTIWYVDNVATQQYELTFNLNGGNIGGSTDAVEVQADAGTFILSHKPANPVRTSYVFGGWAYDNAGANPVDINAIVTEADTLYAIWTAE